MIGLYGCSPSSEPAITGVHSSSRSDQRAQQPRLALAAFTEQHEVVSGDQRPLELGHTVSSKPRMPGHTSRALGERGQQVLADFLLHAPLLMAGGTQLAECAGKIVR